MHPLDFSDLQNYIQYIPYNTNPGALCEESNTNGDPAPLEAADTPLTGSPSIHHQPSRLRLDPEVLASIKRLIEEVEEEMGVNYLDLVKVPEASGAGIYNGWTSTSQSVPEDLYDAHTICDAPSLYNRTEYAVPPPAAVPTHMSSLPELINSRDATLLRSRHDVKPTSSPLMPAMGQPGPSRWHQEQFDPSSIDWSVWQEHDMAAPPANCGDSESKGLPAHNAVLDVVNSTSYHTDNGTNLPLDHDTALVLNANGDEILRKSFTFRSSSPTPYGRTADAAQYQGMFSDHAQPWFQAGEGSNTHHSSTSFSSEREKKETITTGSIKNGREELRSRLTNEPVERQDINEAQTNDGGCGEGAEVGHGQTIGRDEIASRKRRREDTDSEIESAGGPRQPRKPKVQESRESVPGNINTEVQGSRGKPRNLNPRAPAMMRSYAHALTPLTTPEAKEGGFIALVTAGTKEASTVFGGDQTPVDMDSMTMV
ncbi:hypothetical protein JR316_0010344 [Psilocybe cubensis]|nr:hypothetical protein JR316_0010344 [Psilocybe cubensis]KAH9478106.1 hypothetical protein JR316_0010344 [Psilocybe cubensis]